MLALSVALLGPHFVDWESHKADFEREASRILGREVTVRGEATARLLPFPSVTFTDVEVAGASPEEIAMTIETFSMDAELAPLLRGEVLIFDMRLIRPHAFVDIAQDGTVDWTVRPSTPIGARQIMLEKLTVSEGSVTVRHAASGREHQVTGINADISARSLAGPWRLDGSLELDGMRTGLFVSTGAVDERGRMRLRLRADPARYGFTVETEGEARFDEGAPNYAGLFRLNARTGEQLRGSAGETFVLGQEGARTGRAAPAWRVSGRFVLDHEKADVSEFRFETGPLDDPYTAEGRADIGLGADPRFSIVADGAQIRFEDAASGGQGAIALADRLGAFRLAMLSLPKPEIPGRIEVALPAIVAGDTTIRDVRLAAEPVADGWQVGALSAHLPGRTTLEGSGLINTQSPEEFGFAGELLLAVGQPSGFASWLAREVDDAIRRLPGAGFSAQVELTERRQVLENLELMLGDARFAGRAVSERPAGRAPSLTLELDGGRLDVEGLAAFASLFVSDAGDNRLADHDLDFNIRAGPVTVAGVTAETVDTALRLRDGLLEIDRLSVGGLEGASVSATGTLRGIGGPLSGELDATLISADLAPLVELLAERYPGNALLSTLDGRAAAYPGLLDDAEIQTLVNLSARGEGRALTLYSGGEAGGTAFTFDLAAEGSAEDPLGAGIELTLTARNEDRPAALLALSGLPALPLGLLEPARIELEMEGTLAEGASTRFAFLAEDGLEARFDGTAGFGEEGLFAEGGARLEAPDIEPWLMTAGMSLPGMGLGLPVSLSGEASLNDGLLVVSGLEGGLAGNALAGDVNAEMRDGLPHLTGALSLEALDLFLPLAAVVGEEALEGEGGDWPRQPLQPRAAPSFTADLELAADQVTAGGGFSASDARLVGRLDREGLRLSDVEAHFAGGRLAGLFELRNSDGTGLGSGQFRLEGVAVERLLPESGLSGIADLTATVSASGKSFDAMIASLSGSGTVSASGLVVPGFDPGALPALIARAEPEGTGIDATRTAGFAPAIAQAGSFTAEEAELALTIAGGIVRAPPVRMEHPAAVLTADLRADLGRRTVGASGTIEYLPGEEALVGADPLVRFSAEGPLGRMAVSLDTDPLAHFLTQRALEREQARVEAMQAVLLERQRLRREVRYYAALRDERVRREEQRIRFEREQRRRTEQEDAARRRAEAQARAEAETTPDRTMRDGEPIERSPLTPLPGPQPGSAFDVDAIEELLRTLR